MRRGVITGAALGLLSWSSGARAESAHEAWYGWQTLTVDGAALGLVAAGIALRPPHSDWSVVSVAGVGAWAIGAPTVHWAHRRAGVGFLSLGARLALPALGLYLASRPCSSSECSEELLAVALGASLIPAPMVIDAAWLARERKSEDVVALRRSQKLVWAPVVMASEQRRLFGIAARF